MARKKSQEWFDSEEGLFSDLTEVQEVRHDYAHSGFYTKIIKHPATKGSRTKYELLLKHGPRLHYPKCCVEKKHWKVDTSKDKPTWIERESVARFNRRLMRIA